MTTETKQTYSRQDYLNHVCTHEQYYAQFVTPQIKAIVQARIGLVSILASANPHFNDIQLARWDGLSEGMRHFLAVPNEYGDGKRYYSLAGGVCILKEAARQLKEENDAK